MRICAFSHCSNGTYKRKRWDREHCELHNCQHGDQKCTCIIPFKLIPFPSAKTDLKARLEWCRRIYRKDPITGKNWQPKDDDRVCSVHFKDGEPSRDNPYPTLYLGKYSKTTPKTRKPPKNRYIPHVIPEEPSVECSPVKSQHMQDHTYQYICKCSENCSCQGCVDKNTKLLELQSKYDDLKDSTLSTQAIFTTKKVDQTLKYLKSDHSVQIYTGLPNKKAFQDLFNHVSKKAAVMRYWSGQKKTLIQKRRFFKRTPLKSGPNRKLTIKEELLIVLMKLRQNVINMLLGDMFGISEGCVSQIFNTWIKFLAKELRPLIFWPQREVVRERFPSSLSRYPNLRCTIDCTEVFIERPRDLEIQALTWSDYKKHNTVKFLVGIAPNGHIGFLSKTWGGRASDQVISRESGFLDLVERDDLILADRGFTIVEDLINIGAHLYIPPPSSGLEQMTAKNVEKTKDIANARIHVERAIGRIKRFSVLDNKLPITMIPLIDDIVVVYAALCNLLPPLVN